MKQLIKGITWILFGIIATGGMAHAASNNLVIFDWAGYEDPGFFAEYMEKHGKAPDYSFFADEEEAFQKIRTGFRADLAHPCSQSAVKWRKAGIRIGISRHWYSRLEHCLDERSGRCI